MDDSATYDEMPTSVLRLVNERCNHYEADRRAGRAQPIDDYLADLDGEARRVVRAELVAVGDEYELTAAEVPAVIGGYDVARCLGRGGMGAVYLARDPRLGRNVAVKVLRPALAADPAARDRFRREALAAGRLDHPNVVPALDAGEDAGRPYLVSAYVEGEDLAHLVRQTGPLDLPRAVDYVTQAARGLAHAHERGIVHRDVKPANLILGADGVVRVLDLGLARVRDESAPDQTATSIFLGTPAYAAPEQIVAPVTVDARSDVYGLGGVLHYLLTGRAPRPWDDFRGLPAGRALRRLLAANPNERPASMAEVIRLLQSPRRPTRRTVLAAGAVAVLGASAGIIAYVRPRRRDEPPPVAEMPFADPAGYQRRWADHLALPVERADTVGGLEFRFVLVPPGTFRMGSPDDLIARFVERPQLDEWQRALYLAEKARPVTIRRAFYLGKTEVTFAQFGLFVRRTGHPTLAERVGRGWGYHGKGEGWKMGPGFSWKSVGSYAPAPDHPVVNASWSDAAAFCGWLGTEAGGTCRLPAESEWEFACRGGRYGHWGHGDDADALPRFAVYGVRLPAPVGTREPNGFGLFDMHGNASERCAVEDRWTADPARPANLGKAVYPVRGGRHNEVQPGAVDVWPDTYRAARRTWEAEGSLTAGFRVLREIPG